MNLVVTNEWTDYFVDNYMELVNNRVFTIYFEKEIRGDKVSYNEILEIINILFIRFDWLKKEKIRLEYSVEVENKDLQFFNSDTNSLFKEWEDNVKREVGLESPLKDENIDVTNIYYNYKVNIENEQRELYTHTYYDGGYISIGYNVNIDTTFIEIGLDIRKEFFTNDALDEKDEVVLPKEMIKKNITILKDTISKMEENSYRFLSWDKLSTIN